MFDELGFRYFMCLTIAVGELGFRDFMFLTISPYPCHSEEVRSEVRGRLVSPCANGCERAQRSSFNEPSALLDV